MTPVFDWVAELSASEELTPSAVESILEIHGDRGRRAIEGVGETRVKQYNDFTVVVGHRDEYIVEDRGCLCPDAHYNLDSEDPTDLCWHVLAVIIAEVLDRVDEYDLWYAEIEGVLE